MKWRAIWSFAEDQQSERRMDFLHQLMLVFMVELHSPSSNLVAIESCNRKATASGIQILCKINKEILGGAFNEDVDLAGTPETFLRVETHQRWLAVRKTSRARTAISSSTHPALNEPIILPLSQINIRAPGRR